MVSLPGEHEFVLTATFSDPGAITVMRGKINHDITITEPLPVGHAYEKGVDLMDGHLTLSREDISIASVGPPLNFTRTYTSTGNREAGPLGAGWTHNYYSRLTIDQTGTVTIMGGDGGGMRFDANGGAPGGGTSYKPQAGFHGSLVSFGASFDYYSKGRQRYHYEPPPNGLTDSDYRLIFIEDTHGNRLTLTYDNEKLAKVTDASGRSECA